MNHKAFRFTPEAVEALNDVAASLALNDFGPTGPDGMPRDIAGKQVDWIILAGNCVLETAEGAFRVMRSGSAQGF